MTSVLPAILFVTSGLGRGGAEAALYRLVTHRLIQPMVVGIISLTDEGVWGAELRARGIPVEALRLSPGLLQHPGSLWRLRRAVQAYPATLLQGWMYHGNLAATLARSVLPTRGHLLWGIHHALSARETEKWSTRLIIRLGALLSGQPERIIYASAAAAGQHEAIGYRVDRSMFIPNGVDPAHFRPDPILRRAMRERFDIPADVVLAGTLARYHPIKDFATLCAAAARLLPEHRRQLRFFLAGDHVTPANRELRQLVEGTGAPDSFVLAGPVEASDVVPGFDIALLTSRSEAAPNFALEAAACGLPLVLTDVGDCARIAGEGGLLAPAGDAAAIAACLEELVRNPGERARLGHAARKRMLEHYTIDTAAAAYRSMYESLT